MNASDLNDTCRRHLAEGERAGMRYRLTVPRDSVSGHIGFDMGRNAGTSLDFKDYREYQPGDDLRHIDWHAFARTDRLTVKLYREEVSPHVDIVLDGSSSMALENTEKARAALGLSALLAVAAVNARCTASGWLAGNGIRRVSAGTEQPSLWNGVELDYRGNPADAFGSAPAWRRRGIRIFISDLLWPGEPRLVLQRLSEGAATVIVIQLLARSEAEAPLPGSTTLIDVETDEALELFVDSEARARYARALAEHQQNWHRACRQAGALIATVVAEDIAGAWKLDALENAQILGAA